MKKVTKLGASRDVNSTLCLSNAVVEWTAFLRRIGRPVLKFRSSNQLC
jgi:hypothetical protein